MEAQKEYMMCPRSHGKAEGEQGHQPSHTPKSVIHSPPISFQLWRLMPSALYLQISQAQPLRTGLLLLTIAAAVEGYLGEKEQGRELLQSHLLSPPHPSPILAALTSLALSIVIRLWLAQNGKDLILQGVSDTEQPLLEGSIEGGPHCA